jgi:hypothetical protein
MRYDPECPKIKRSEYRWLHVLRVLLSIRTGYHSDILPEYLHVLKPRERIKGKLDQTELERVQQQLEVTVTQQAIMVKQQVAAMERRLQVDTKAQMDAVRAETKAQLDALQATLHAVLTASQMRDAQRTAAA